MINIILVQLTGLAVLSWGQVIQPDSDEEVIKKLFENTYLRVMCNSADPKILEPAFHPEFHMYVYYNGKITVRDRDQWIEKLISNRGKASGNRRGEITLLDITGTAASVRVVFFSENKIKYTDYFTLYKVNGKWQVFTKVFNIH